MGRSIVSDEIIHMGVDMGGEGGAVFSTFRNDFLTSIATSLGVSFEAMEMDYARTTYSVALADRAAEGRLWTEIYRTAGMGKARALIRRAAAAMVAGERGYGRKLKRARRLQVEACGWRYSNSWFSLEWQFACSSERLKALSARRSMMAFHFPKIAPEYVKELTAERLTPQGWKPMRGRRAAFIVADEIDNYGEPYSPTEETPS
jgi:hypothetical protein